MGNFFFEGGGTYLDNEATEIEENLFLRMAVMWSDHQISPKRSGSMKKKENASRFQCCVGNVFTPAAGNLQNSFVWCWLYY